VPQALRVGHRNLIYRTAMPEDSGMLFIFPEEREGGFRMFNTRIPNERTE
jgi:uncharacterized membrane protein (UPF0127 family)